MATSDPFCEDDVRKEIELRASGYVSSCRRSTVIWNHDWYSINTNDYGLGRTQTFHCQTSDVDRITSINCKLDISVVLCTYPLRISRLRVRVHIPYVLTAFVALQRSSEGTRAPGGG